MWHFKVTQITLFSVLLNAGATKEMSAYVCRLFSAVHLLLLRRAIPREFMSVSTSYEAVRCMLAQYRAILFIVARPGLVEICRVILRDETCPQTRRSHNAFTLYSLCYGIIYCSLTNCLEFLKNVMKQDDRDRNLIWTMCEHAHSVASYYFLIRAEYETCHLSLWWRQATLADGCIHRFYSGRPRIRFYPNIDHLDLVGFMVFLSHLRLFPFHPMTAFSHTLL
jgi:hypothetical protein